MLQIKSFLSSTRFIINFRYGNPIIGISKYIIWQVLKKLNRFPRNVRYSNSTIHFMDLNIANQGGTKLFTCGVYDYDNMFFAREILKHFNGIFYDIGANIGFYSIFISEEPMTKVVSFEPHPVTFSYLINNLGLNKRKNIQCFNLALGNSDSMVNFSNSPGSSTNKVINECGGENNYIQITQKKLSQIIGQISLIPDVVKIDTEGYELNVLLGLEMYLSEIKLLILEVSKDENEINGLLSKYFYGPCFVDFKNKLIKKERYYCEDPVYINKLNMNEILTKLNYKSVCEK